MNFYKKPLIAALLFCFAAFSTGFAQDTKAKTLLDQVSAKVKSYDNMFIDFKYGLSNDAAGINQETRGDVTLDVSNDLLRRQVTVIGSWTFSKYGQAECADFVADKKLDIDKLFTHTWTLDQAEEAYKLFDKQSDGKGVIIP